MEAIRSTATQILLQLTLAMLTLLGAYGTYYAQKAVNKVKVQISQIKDDSARTLFTNALEDVNELVGVTVGSIEQTTAATIREAVKAGKADRDTLLALGKQAFDTVKAAVTPEAQEIITQNLGSFDDYLQNLIENTVLKVKQKTSYITLPESTVPLSNAADAGTGAADEPAAASDETPVTVEAAPAADEAPATEETSPASVEAAPSGQ